MEEFLRPPVVSKRIDVSEATLRRWRATGQGPAFLRVGRQVRYRASDVDAWLQNACQPAGDAA